MRKLLRKIIAKTAQPFLAKRYLKKERQVKIDGLILSVPPSVFHPGFFYSSKFFARFLGSLPLADHKVLDVGCGSGVLSLIAARKGAKVTAIDINPEAIKVAELNSQVNDVSLSMLQSDLFANVQDTYDYILVNPPYYPKSPKDMKEYAWYCGESFQYFTDFFGSLSQVVHDDSKMYMVLSDGCDLPKINSLAEQHNWKMIVRKSRQFLLERNYIFEIISLPKTS